MVLEAVRPQAWNILITHFHLTTLKVCTFIQTNLVVLGILKKKATFQAVFLHIPSKVAELKTWEDKYHSNGSDWHHAVTPVAVGPGIPAGVLSLLQHEHLTSHILLLVTHPAEQIGRRDVYLAQVNTCCAIAYTCVCQIWSLTVHILPWWSQSFQNPSHTGYGTLQTGPSFGLGSSHTHRGISGKKGEKQNVAYWEWVFMIPSYFVVRLAGGVPCCCEVLWRNGCQRCPEHLSETWSDLKRRITKLMNQTWMSQTA